MLPINITKVNKFKEEKGKEGETLVFNTVVLILNAIKEPYRILKNIHMKYESVYGINGGYSTAEMDLIVITLYFIFIIEIKNENYEKCSYADPQWNLTNNAKTPNPIIQNYNHKLIFCSNLELPREKVITIEVLLGNGKAEGNRSQYPNDYVFSREDYTYQMRSLLTTKSNETLNINNIYYSVLQKSKEYYCNDKSHKEAINRYLSITTRIKNVMRSKGVKRYSLFRMTDIIKCPKCGDGSLYFGSKLWYSTQDNERKSRHYFLKCTNQCPLIYIDQNKSINDFLALKPIHLQERNNWVEEKEIKTNLN